MLAPSFGETGKVRFEFLIGMRYLRARRQERFVSLIAVISLAGVMLGTFALSVDLAVMSGFEEDLHQRLLAFTPHLTIQSPQGQAPDSALEARVRGLAGVIGVAPYVSGQVLLASSETATSAGYVKSGAVMRGVVAPDNPVLAGLSQALTPNALDALASLHPITVGIGTQRRQVNLPAVVLGKSLAADLDVVMGDTVTLISPTSFGAAADVPRLKRFVVGGLLHSGMAEYDASLLFVNLTKASALAGDSPQFEHGLEVRLANILDAPAMRERIARMLGAGYTVSDWTQTNIGLFSGLKLETFTHFLVLMLIVLVAAFNIVATLVMVVMERRKEVAILQAMGAPANSVAAIFLFEGALLGLVGTIAGVGAGFIASYLIGKYHLIHLPPDVFMVSAVPARLYPANFLLVAVAAIALCICAALYPAWQARSLSPVEVLRYE
jgi:lipoprotein-releasing system permease protein